MIYIQIMTAGKIYNKSCCGFMLGSEEHFLYKIIFSDVSREVLKKHYVQFAAKKIRKVLI